MSKKKTNVTKIKPAAINPEGLMEQAFNRMVDAQINFSDIAVSRAIEIAKQNNVDLAADKGHILGVSFAPGMAIVAAVYETKIAIPGQEAGPHQVNIPIPAECLWAEDWRAAYERIKFQHDTASKAAAESGELDRAFTGEEKQIQE